MDVVLFCNKVDEISHILNKLKIKVKNIKVEETDYFDKYDIMLADGIRYNKLERLLPDIGMALKAQSIPIGYPIMNRGVYRIEVQKRELASVPYTELEEVRKDGYSPISLGVDNYGKPFGIDLQTLPNLLIGGTPGSGKSMLLHSIILSLVEANAKLFLVDPKMVEFNLYDDVRQVERIENSVEGVYSIIDDVTNIMNKRFQRLSDSGVRDVLSYNKTSSNKMRPIVVIVDEWADIILQDKKIQKPLCVLAQKGRAAGISIILATQRPSSEVIPGLIKANFSGRIVLRVASYRDSMVVLDQKGGEKLSDVGSGLYLDHRNVNPILFRSPFISDLRSAKEFAEQKNNDKKETFWNKVVQWLS